MERVQLVHEYPHDRAFMMITLMRSENADMLQLENALDYEEEHTLETPNCDS